MNEFEKKLMQSKLKMRVQSYGEENQPTFLDKTGNKLSQILLKKFLGGLENYCNSTLLDLGSGYHARLSKPFFQYFQSVILLDVSLNRNVFLSMPNVISLEGNAINSLSSLKANSVDIVFAINVIEHLESIDFALAEIHRILKDNGKALFIAPSWFAKRILEFCAFRVELVPVQEIEDHKRYFSKNEFWLHLRRAGFFPSNIKIRRGKLGMVYVASVIKHIHD